MPWSSEKIKEWRSTFPQSISQSQAASLIGVSLDTYKSWEAGRRPVPFYAGRACLMLKVLWFNRKMLAKQAREDKKMPRSKRDLLRKVEQVIPLPYED